jgi:hypothetical protein
MSEKVPNKTKKVSRKKVVLVVVLLLLLLGVGWCVRFFMQPSIGRVIGASDGERVTQVSTGRVRSDAPAHIEQEPDRVVTECFSYHFPTQYNPRPEIKDDACVVRSTIYDPKGSLTVSWKKIPEGQTFSEDTGLQRRMRETEQYTSHQLGGVSQSEQFSQLTAFTAKRETTVFASVKGGVFVVSLHEFLGNQEEADQIVKAVLESVEFP